MSKISELTDGGSLLPTDSLIAVRSGANVKVKADTINVDQIDLGDNEKIRLGNSQDLQVYHDGSNSIVADVGTGGLFLSGSSYVAILNGDRSEYMLNANVNGEVGIYYDNSKKLATTATGIDVTGTIVGDGLTVDGVIKTESGTPTIQLSETDQTDLNTLLRSTGGDFQINKMLDDGSSSTRRFVIDQSTGDISFYNSTGVSQSLFFDASAESLSIGTTTAGRKLQVYGGTAGATDSRNFRIADSGGTTGNRYDFSLENTGALAINNGTSDIPLVKFHNNSDFSLGNASGTTKLFWDASASSLGIGTTSPATKLSVVDTSAVAVQISLQNSGRDWRIGPNSGVGSSSLTFFDNTANQTRMVIDDGGNVGIGVTPSAWASGFKALQVDNSGLYSATSANNFYMVNNAYYDNPTFKYIASDYAGIAGFEDGAFKWFQAASGTAGNAVTFTQAMTLDTSGNLLVGTTDASPVTSNVDGIVLKNNGQVQFSYTGTGVAMNRKGSDGNIIDFRKDGTSVGSIALQAGQIEINGNPSAATTVRFGTTATLYPNTDAVGDIGASTKRFKDLYLSGGVYVGGAVAANYLDDYEEGTWTPTYLGSTTDPTPVYDLQSGTYTKVGNVVILTCILGADSTSGGSGTLLVGGVPFAPTTAGAFTQSSAPVITGTTWTTTQPAYVIASGDSYSDKLFIASDSKGSYLSVSDLPNTTNGARLRFTITYQTD